MPDARGTREPGMGHPGSDPLAFLADELAELRARHLYRPLRELTTAQGPVVAVVKTHEFSDTVTLRAGFVEQSTYDSSVPPPTGASTWGSATVTVNGTIESVQAGGLLDIATLPTAPLVTYSDDMYPSAGTVQVRGSTGSLQIRAVSPTSAALALDANDDAVFESTSTVTWDWLL